jgi:hypothetical protein
MTIEQRISDNQQVWIVRGPNRLQLVNIFQAMAPGADRQVHGSQRQGGGKQSGQQGSAGHDHRLKIDVDELGRLPTEGIDEHNGQRPHRAASYRAEATVQKTGSVVALAAQIFESGTKSGEHQPTKSLL